MKIGDLVTRKPTSPDIDRLNKAYGTGLVLSVKTGGSPIHYILTVYYGKVAQTWDIGESYMEIYSEN